MSALVAIYDARTGADLGSVEPWLADELSRASDTRLPWAIPSGVRFTMSRPFNVATDERALVVCDPPFEGSSGPTDGPPHLSRDDASESGAHPSTLADGAR